jgi:hypothetical protein
MKQLNRFTKVFNDNDGYFRIEIIKYVNEKLKRWDSFYKVKNNKVILVDYYTNVCENCENMNNVKWNSINDKCVCLGCYKEIQENKINELIGVCK